jgi:hypothetical protein
VEPVGSSGTVETVPPVLHFRCIKRADLLRAREVTANQETKEFDPDKNLMGHDHDIGQASIEEHASQLTPDPPIPD